MTAHIVRHRYEWEGNIKPHLKELEWEGVDWIYLTQDRGQKWQAVWKTVQAVS